MWQTTTEYDNSSIIEAVTQHHGVYNSVSMEHQLAETREKDDIQICQKTSAGVVPKAAQPSDVFQLDE